MSRETGVGLEMQISHRKLRVLYSMNFVLAAEQRKKQATYVAR
jgi:hypothetical protein